MLLLAQSLSIQIALCLLHFPSASPPAAIVLIYRFPLFRPDWRCWTSLVCGGLLDRRIPLILPSHTTPGECDAEPGIVTVSDIGRPIAKIIRDEKCEFCLAAPRDA